MRLSENPFAIIGASLRDGRADLISKAELVTLSKPDVDVSTPRSVLTNPRRRLEAEVAWLVGVAPAKTQQLIERAAALQPDDAAVQGLPPLATCNLLAESLFSIGESPEASRVRYMVSMLVQAAERIEPERVAAAITEDRLVAGFPEVHAGPDLDKVLSEQRRTWTKAMLNALDELETSDLVSVVTDLVDALTTSGTRHGQGILGDLVDRYEDNARAALESGAERVGAAARDLLAAAEAGKPETELVRLTDWLARVTWSWDRIAQPIQVSRLSRGLEHEMSRDVADMIRDLAITLHNEHGLTDLAKRLTELSTEVFAEVSKVVDQLSDDLDALESFEASRQASEVELRRELEYSTTLGVIFKDKLAISPDGVWWKDFFWRLEDVTRIRWGATQNHVNGVHTSTDYRIAFGDASRLAVVKLREDGKFNSFVTRLWKGVGVRLIVEMLRGLEDGKAFRFGPALIHDDCVVLPRRVFLSSRDVRVPLGDLSHVSYSGSLHLQQRSDSKARVELSFQDEDNVHVLAAILRVAESKGVARLSDSMKS